MTACVYMVTGLSKLQNCKHKRNKETEFGADYLTARFMLYVYNFHAAGLKEYGIFLIKIADQIDNLSDINAISKENHLRKKEQIRNYFIPIYDSLDSAFWETKKIRLGYEDLISELRILSEV